MTKPDLFKQLLEASRDLQAMHAVAVNSYRRDVADAIRAAGEQVARAIGHLAVGKVAS